MRRRLDILSVLSLLVALVFHPISAEAQSLVDGDFNVDLSVGTAMGSSRAIGMGGAFAAIAEGIDGAYWNPASYGSRSLWERHWFEWDLTAEIFFPGAFVDWDVYNNGLGRNRGPESSLSLGLGLRFQFDYLGIGAVGRGIRFRYEESAGQELNIRVGTTQSGGAFGFFDGQIVIGLGIRWVTMTFRYTDLAGEDLTFPFFSGGGLEAGAIVRLAEKPWRLGLTLSTDVRSGVVAPGGMPAPGIALPEAAYLPGRIQVGFAYQVGDRPFNQRWVRPKNARVRLAEELLRERCERELEQLRRELREAGERAASFGCPLSTRHPSDPDWWVEEDRLRELEDAAMDEAVQEARRAIHLEQERWYESLTRRYLLISSQLTIESAVPDAIGLDAFLEQEDRPRGETVTVGFALGLESEVIPGWLQLRAGTYVEPGRNSGVSPRPHGTAGFTLKLIAWDFFGLLDPFTFRLNFAIDGASGYFNWGLGIGFWH